MLNFQVKSNCYLADSDNNKPDSKEDYLSFYQVICLIAILGVDNNFIAYKIAMNTDSSASIFCNSSLLSNIKPRKKMLKVVINSSQINLNSTRHFRKMKAQCNGSSLVNILSLSYAAKKYRVTIDTLIGKAIFAEIDQKKWIYFEQNYLGLLAHDAQSGTCKCKICKISRNLTSYSFFQITPSNSSNFTAKEVRIKGKAYPILRRIGFTRL